VSALRRMLICTALCAALAPAAFAQDPDANCANVQFSPEVLAVTPQIRAMCVLIAQSGGRTLAVVEAEVSRRAANGSIAVRFQLPGGKQTRPHSVPIEPESRVRIGARAVRVADLEVGQHLSMFIDVERPVIALEPPDENEPLALQPLRAPVSAPGSEYSRTAPSGMLLLGGLALLLGASAAAVRIRMSQR
jgi:hypothetical protein